MLFMLVIGRGNINNMLCGLHCGTRTESILHVFWLCPKIKQFWRQHYSHSNFSWGATLWGVLHGEVMKYETMHASHVFRFSYENLSLTSFPSSIQRFRIKNLVIWHTITSLALWIIWKARCDYVFNNVHIHLNSMRIEFWMLFVHTLRGQYDDLQGSDEVLWQQQVAFKNRWQGLHLVSYTTIGLKWNYVVPFYMLVS